MSNRPDDIARELGLSFETIERKDAKGRVHALSFKFKLPEMSTPEYVPAVNSITTWAKKVHPWVYVVPKGEAVTVASKMTWWNRLSITKTNRKNRKLIAKHAAEYVEYASDDAVARRFAMTQPTPAQALNVLKDRVPNSTDPETLKLKATLEQAAALVESNPETKSAAAQLDNVIQLRASA